jgi:hypothetical protein
MSSSFAIVLGLVVLALTGVIVLLVRELVLRTPPPRVLPPPQHGGPIAPGPVYRSPRVNRFGELEDP